MDTGGYMANQMDDLITSGIHLYDELAAIKTEDIGCYRGTSNGTTIYMKNGEMVYTAVSFEKVDEIFNL